MRKKVLFVTYGGGHAKIIRALTDEIQRQKLDLEVTVFGLTTAPSAFHGSGVKVIGFRHLVQPDDAEAIQKGQELLASMTPHPNVEDAESVAYLGLSYADLVQQLGEAEALKQYQEKGRQVFHQLGSLRRCFDLYQPDLVVTTNSPRAEEAAIRVAGERGIPSICIMDLFGGFEVERISQPGYASKVCVLSDPVKATLVKAGRDSKDIQVTGNPAFDHYADPSIAAHASKWKSSLGFNGKKLVLWASQTEPTDKNLSLRILDTLIKGLQDDPNVQIIFRPHPSETLDLANLPPQLHISTQKEPLATVVKACDCVVVISSTVGLEACLLGVPLVALIVPVTIETAPYAENGMALPAVGLDELTSVVKQSLEGKRAPGAQLPEIGQAASKIIDQMMELLHNEAQTP